ncbi:hypothetical protein [Roseixanthobacter liquoris]|uniref:hypothetical protein n=1 Tax=Roseixanthobacter liquoris TaxID=3119921 RepID=UPI0037294DBD
MLDRYTKIVLTIIAVTLVAHLGERLFGSAQAASGNCGNISQPCVVVIGVLDQWNKPVLCREGGTPCFTVVSK